MKDTIIYINDEAVDLSEDTVISQTLKRMNVGDPTTRIRSYTNAFNMPFTEKNHRIYENSNKINSLSTLPYRKQTARMIQEGIEMVSNGIHNLREASSNYEAYILYGIADLFEVIGEKKLIELNFTGLNGDWSDSAKQAARLNTTGIVAPVIDYGDFVADDPTFGNFMPMDKYLFSVYYHTLIDKIFSEAGFTKTGNVFSEDKYLKTIIPYSRGSYLYDDKFVNDRFASVRVSTPQSIPTPGTGVNVVFGDTVKQGAAGFWDGVDEYLISDADPAAAGEILFAFDASLVLNITVTGGTVNIVLDGGADVITKSNLGTGVYAINSKDETLSDVAMLAEEGENVRVRIVKNTGTPSVTVNAGSLVINALGLVGSGFTYFNYLLPDMTQKDLIKDFLISYALIPNQAGKNIHFKSLNEIISDKASAFDWTAKRVIDNQPKIKFAFNNYAQENIFKYSTKGDLFDHNGSEFPIDENIGTGTFPIDNLNIPSSKTIYQSPFNNTLTEILGGIMMARIPVDITSPTDFRNDPGLRKLLVRTKYSGEPTVGYASPASHPANFLVAYFESPDEANSLDWNNFLDENYSEFISSLEKGKVVTMDYLLNGLDIIQIDFHKLVFDDNSYYMINSVNNYVPQEPTQVELFKVI